MTKKAVGLIVLAVIALALGVSAFFLFSDSGEKNEDNRIKITDVAKDDIESIRLTNSYGEFDIKRYEIDGKNELRISGLEDIPPLTVSYDTIVKNAACLTASRLYIEGESEENLGNYGFDDSKIGFVVTTGDGKKHSVFFGNQSPDKTGYYAKSGENNNIYIVKDTVVQVFDQPEENFISMRIIGRSFTDDVDIRSIMLGGSCRENMKIEAYEDEMSSHHFKVTSPEKAFTVEENMIDLTRMLTSPAMAEDIISLHPTDKEIKQYGFDRPYSTVEFVLENDSVKFTVANAVDKDGDILVMADDNPSIYRVKAENLSGYDYDAGDLISPLIFSCGIDYIKGFDVEYSGKSYIFEIDSASSSATLDGRECDYGNASYLYTGILSFTRQAQSDRAVGGEKVLKIELRYNNDRENSLIECYRRDDKYYCFIDNENMGELNSNSFDVFLKELSNFD